jgi:hypothetical protein
MLGVFVLVGVKAKRLFMVCSRVLLAGLRFGLWVLVSRLFVGFCGFSLYFFCFFWLAHV